MRPNRAKQKLRDGRAVLAPKLAADGIPDIDSLEELMAHGLFDIAWIEMEHGRWSWNDLSDISRACDLWGVTSLVRANLNEPAVIGRTLDRGIQGVLVPHVNTRADAERAVSGALYPPKGTRGMYFPRRGYGVTNFLQTANDEVLVVVLLEELHTLQHNLKDILAVPDVDVFFIGPGDLSLTMGPQYAGQLWHPDVQAVVQEAVKTIVGAGKIAGTVVNDANVDEYLRLGARMLRYTATTYLTDGLRGFQQKVSAAH
jgi:4-hydroxy-2-oxoheptanedioate aldolase